jgi:hypothetical protein
MGKHSGDDHLSSYELMLWQLHQDVILRFQCYAIMRYRRTNFSTRSDALIEFFVPADHSHALEVVQHLNRELEHLIQSPECIKLPDGREEHYPGTQVSVRVHDFSGIQPHIPYRMVKKLTQDAVSTMMANIKRNVKDKKDS